MSGIWGLTRKLSFTADKNSLHKKKNNSNNNNIKNNNNSSEADSVTSDLQLKLFLGTSSHSTCSSQSALTCVDEEDMLTTTTTKITTTTERRTESIRRIKRPHDVWASVSLKDRLGKSVKFSDGPACDATDISEDPPRAWKILKVNGMHAYAVSQASVLNPAKSRSSVRVVCMSDTHGRHADMEHKIPAGDILIHAGDFTRAGAGGEIEDFLAWFASQPHKHKILIGGNHDITLDSEFYDKHYRRFGHFAKYNQKALKEAVRTCPGVVFLEDEVVEVLGLKIYGAPWQPKFCRWAFQKARGEELRTTWEKVPNDVDILITHGPPLGYGDMIHTGDHVGDVDLLREVQCRIKPRLHVFGHIHESAGLFRHEGEEEEVGKKGSTLFLNASTCTQSMHPRHPVICVDLDVRKTD